MFVPHDLTYRYTDCIYVFFFQQDGLWLVTQQPSVIQGYQKGIITPNFMEFTRLYEALVGPLAEIHGMLNLCVWCSACFFIWSLLPFQHHEPVDSSDHKRNVIQLSAAMGNVTLVLKGEQDLITDGSKGWYQILQVVIHLLSLGKSLLTYFIQDSSFMWHHSISCCFQCFHAMWRAAGEDVVDRVTSSLDLWEYLHTGPMLHLQLAWSEGKYSTGCSCIIFLILVSSGLLKETNIHSILYFYLVYVMSLFLCFLYLPLCSSSASIPRWLLHLVPVRSPDSATVKRSRGMAGPPPPQIWSRRSAQLSESSLKAETIKAVVLSYYILAQYSLQVG